MANQEFLTRMVCFYYKSCLRYTILVRSPRNVAACFFCVCVCVFFDRLLLLWFVCFFVLFCFVFFLGGGGRYNWPREVYNIVIHFGDIKD